MHNEQDKHINDICRNVNKAYEILSQIKDKTNDFESVAVITNTLNEMTALAEVFKNSKLTDKRMSQGRDVMDTLYASERILNKLEAALQVAK